MKGNIWLIPVTLGGDDYRAVIPSGVIEVTKRLRLFIAEDLRSARRYLRTIDKQFPINESEFQILSEHTRDSEIMQILEPVLSGSDAGLMSEAGMPGIADPGAKVVDAAHRYGIKIIPLSGPSSIFMALAASGMNGQNFTFNGYLPVKPEQRIARLREIEREARKGYAQIFMETPYRNQAMLESILEVCSNDTRLCIGADITLPREFIRTRKIAEWKKEMPDLKNRQVIFILQ